MTSRIPAVLVLAAIVLATATGCLPATQPSASPSPDPTFTSAERAFAAAEKTYRAYVDALNHVDLSDPKTFEAVYAWTTGDALAGAKQSFSQMHADGWVVSGPTVARLVQPLDRVNWRSTTLDLAICLDVGRVNLVDARGASVVDPDRRDVQSMKVTMRHSPSSTAWRISAINGRDGAPACS